jgi:hypothetical protein
MLRGEKGVRADPHDSDPHNPHFFACIGMTLSAIQFLLSWGLFHLPFGSLRTCSDFRAFRMLTALILRLGIALLSPYDSFKISFT